MDLRQLAALAAVADHHSFSAAAKALHTVQSNVSSHIAKLERELGVTLVDRANGILTDEGSLVVERARRIMIELEAVQSDLAFHAGHITGRVRLGMIGTVGAWLLPLLIPSIAESHPGIHLVIVDATTTSLVPQLVAGSLDAAVVNLPVHDPDLECDPLFDEDRVVLAPKGHPLADQSRTRITIAKLAAHPLLLEPPGTAFRDDLDQAAARSGVALQALAEVDGLRALAALSQQGFGAAILPATAAPIVVPAGWARLQIVGLTPRTVGLATSSRARATAPAHAVTEAVRRIVAENAANLPGVQALTQSD